VTSGELFGGKGKMLTVLTISPPMDNVVPGLPTGYRSLGGATTDDCTRVVSVFANTLKQNQTAPLNPDEGRDRSSYLPSFPFVLASM
jgi:hypothetical protein